MSEVQQTETPTSSGFSWCTNPLFIIGALLVIFLIALIVIIFLYNNDGNNDGNNGNNGNNGNGNGGGNIFPPQESVFIEDSGLPNEMQETTGKTVRDSDNTCDYELTEESLSDYHIMCGHSHTSSDITSVEDVVECNKNSCDKTSKCSSSSSDTIKIPNKNTRGRNSRRNPSSLSSSFSSDESK